MSRASRKVPYGWQRERGSLVEAPAEAAVVQRMLDRRRHGQTLRQIASDLNSDGVPTQRGGAWHASTVWRIISVNARRSPGPKVR